MEYHLDIGDELGFLRNAKVVLIFFAELFEFLRGIFRVLEERSVFLLHLFYAVLRVLLVAHGRISLS